MRSLGFVLMWGWLSAVVVNAGEMIESEIYKQWASFKPGTTVVLAGEQAVAGQKTVTEISYTLKSVSPTEVVVTMATSTKGMGQSFNLPPQEMRYPAKVEKMKEVEETPNMPKPKLTKGTETLTIAGKKYECEWTLVETNLQGTKSKSKTWTSKEVPGYLVKSETVIEGPFSSTNTMVLKELTIK